MVVYFNNDGTYKQDAVNAPILVNKRPIGFISEVNEGRVTCCLFDKYVSKEESYKRDRIPYEKEFRALVIK